MLPHLSNSKSQATCGLSLLDRAYSALPFADNLRLVRVSGKDDNYTARIAPNNLLIIDLRSIFVVHCPTGNNDSTERLREREVKNVPSQVGVKQCSMPAPGTLSFDSSLRNQFNNSMVQTDAVKIAIDKATETGGYFNATVAIQQLDNRREYSDFGSVNKFCLDPPRREKSASRSN